MQSKETNFKIVQSGGKININKFYEEFIDFKNIVSEFIVEQRKFNSNMMSRLDNIVKLNNLKE